MNRRGPWLVLLLALMGLVLATALVSRHHSLRISVAVFIGGLVIVIPAAVAVWAYRRRSRQSSREGFRGRPARIVKSELIRAEFVREEYWSLIWRLYEAALIGGLLLIGYLFLAVPR